MVDIRRRVLAPDMPGPEGPLLVLQICPEISKAFFVLAMTLYIVDTPASMAEDRVKANNKALSICNEVVITFARYLQHCKPIKNAKRSTGAVYCPSVLYDGCVTRKGK